MATPGPSTVPLLARVRVTAGVGIVRFVGQTAFAAGKWIGIELDEEGTGKNDGSVQGTPYFQLKKHGTLSGVFVRPSQVHIIDARPQDEYDDEALQEDNEDVDISQDEIQGEAIPEDDEVFAIPAPPKTLPKRATSRPSSVASSARSALISPPPATPSANRRLSARPASRVTSTSSSTLASPSASPRPSISTRPSLNTPAVRPGSRPTPASRISSTSSIASTASATRRESALPSRSTTTTTAASRTPGRPLLASRTASQQAPVTPRPSAVDGSLGTVRKSVTPRTTEAQSTQMTRGISSSSSHSSIASASRLARPLSRPTTKADMEPPMRTIKSPTMFDGHQTSPESAVADGSPQSQSGQAQRAGKQSVEEARFSLQPAISGPSLDPKPPLTVPARLYEELQLKYKLLENGRAEDRERLKEMERIKEDAEAWNVARPKLQNKMIELSNEVKDLRRQIKDDEAERQGNTKKLEDLTDQLEMEMLDKEVAEEKLEDLQNQLESAKERTAELEIELEVLRKEEARIVHEAGEGLEAESGDVKSSLAFIQLAKQNERLKEALVRLRDMSTENEQEYKRRIADLEKELDLTSDLQSAFDTTLEQLEQAEATVEHLKVQLDDAMGAEDMLEHLTERNLTLSERIEEMHAVIQDLEALKELNDELEENHVENEKHMQEEIDLKDHQIREYQKQVDDFEDSMLDYEGTISQFRELVINLQNDLEQLREQQQAQRSEKASLSSQSQAMLNLNMKLQSTVVRNQSKAVDFELRKFEALQAREQLQMVIPYLPSVFQEDDKAAIDALLFFSRLVCKTHVLINTLDQTHGLQDGNYPDTIPEALVTACETRWRLARFMILCKRFTANLQRCEPQTFIRMGKVYVEMLSMEKRIDAFINASKEQELKEAECGDEIDRFLAQAAHVAELHIGESGLDFGEQHLGQTMSVDYDLDTFIAGVGYTKQALALVVNDPDVVFESGDMDIDEVVFARLQGLLDSARAVKMTTRKLVRRLEEVAEGAGSLRPEVAEGFLGASVNVRSIAVFASKLASLISRYTLEVRTSKDPFVLSTFFGIVQEAAAEVRSESKDLLGVEVILHTLKQRLTPALSAALEPENVVKVTYEAPWIARANEMHRNTARDEEAERKVIKLTEDIRDLARELRLKDQNIQESAVKIELLQKRMEIGKKQADSAAELDVEVAKLREQEREFEQTIAQLQKDLDSLERENAKLKQAVPAEKNTNNLDPSDFTTFTGSLETSHLVEQIESLRGTVRYLRHQNSHLKSQGLFKDFYRLPTYETVVSDDKRESRSREFAQESHALLKQVASLSSRVRVVDVSKTETGKAWQPLARQPSAQLAAKRQTLEKLKARIDKLADDKKELSMRRALPNVVRL